MKTDIRYTVKLAVTVLTAALGGFDRFALVVLTTCSRVISSELLFQILSSFNKLSDHPNH